MKRIRHVWNRAIRKHEYNVRSRSCNIRSVLPLRLCNRLHVEKTHRGTDNLLHECNIFPFVSRLNRIRPNETLLCVSIRNVPPVDVSNPFSLNSSRYVWNNFCTTMSVRRRRSECFVSPTEHRWGILTYSLLTTQENRARPFIHYRL